MERDETSEFKMLCSDSEEEERPRSHKTSVDLSSLPWPNNIVNSEGVSGDLKIYLVFNEHFSNFAERIFRSFESIKLQKAFFGVF